ncbi:MAG: hypothetical protein DI630_05925 [Gordonia sp. (in: high G+C Gram-positive bacteria)]|nr:MAG: hypothetical protein DI630_05925 [Gordonia sp. (in: high G+C Gram-positive bacteria)]
MCTIKVLSSSNLSESGVEILARRLSAASPHLDVDHLFVGPSVQQTTEIDKTASLSEHLALLKNARLRGEDEHLMVLGLPRSTLHCSRIIEELSRRGTRATLLWERVGYDPVTILEGLPQLAGVASIATLNSLHSDFLRDALPSSRVHKMSAALPKFLFPGEGTTGSLSTHFGYLGRVSESKGVYRLADVWSRVVYPSMGTVLEMRLLEPSDAQLRKLNALAGVRASTLRSLFQRREFARKARAIVFPASHDHLPQALLESMASGALVIVTPIVGHLDVVRNRQNGLVVDRDLSNLSTVVEEVQTLEAAARSAMTSRASADMRLQHSQEASRRSMRTILGGVG